MFLYWLHLYWWPVVAWWRPPTTTMRIVHSGTIATGLLYSLSQEWSGHGSNLRVFQDPLALMKTGHSFRTNFNHPQDIHRRVRARNGWKTIERLTDRKRRGLPSITVSLLGWNARSGISANCILRNYLCLARKIDSLSDMQITTVRLHIRIVNART